MGLNPFWITEYTALDLYGADYQAFHLFDFTHIFWLVLTAVFCTAVCLIYRKSSQAVRRKIQLELAIAIFAVEAARIVATLATGQWRSESLPLHMCSVSIVVSLWHGIHPNKFAACILYTISTSGAAAALLSPSWCAIPINNYFHIVSEVTHILLFTYPIMLIAGGFIPDIRVLPKVILAVVVMLAVVNPVNIALGTNFFFIGDPHGNPITVLCASIFGEKLFIIGYIIIALILFTLMYAPFVIYSRVRSKAEVTV